MKTYESLKLDIIHFEAQDVVTASVVLDTNCVCTFSDPNTWYHWDNDGSGASCTADIHNHTCGNYCQYH